jgi:antitoxin VapB
VYTAPMALEITDPEIEEKIRHLAAATGETIPEAVAAAIEERLAKVKPAVRKGKPTVEEIQALVRSFHLQPINEDLTEDKILGYGPDGYCV